MSNDQTTGWQPASTAPRNGDEFWYWARGRPRRGSLASDCGGDVRLDPDMTAWLPMLQGSRMQSLPPPPPPRLRRRQ
jgi:hypothetical protein